MRNFFAFIDEYGNNSFDFSTQGTHFIISAILVAESDKSKIEEEIELFVKNIFKLEK